MRLKLSNAAALATLAALAGPSLSAAQEPPTGGAPSEGAEFLLLPVGARAVGMGGAVTGMRGIGELVLWNPAGVAAMMDRRLLFNHSESAFDTRSDVLSLAWPLRSIGTFALTYYLVDYGELTSTDPSGSVTGTINFRNQEFLLTYATRIVGPLEFGINYKLIQLIFRCDGICAGTQSFTRTTHAFDFGLIWDGVAGVPLSLGGSLRHLGFPLKGEDEDDPLPTRVRVGVAYQALSAFTTDSTVTLVLTLDLEDQTRDLGAPEVMVGSEFGVTGLFFIRAGYAFLDTGFGGPTLGLGVTYDWFYLDLSRGFDEISSATGEDAVQVSFGIIF
jgi:hypothetical protein